MIHYLMFSIPKFAKVLCCNMSLIKSSLNVKVANILGSAETLFKSAHIYKYIKCIII